MFILVSSLGSGEGADIFTGWLAGPKEFWTNDVCQDTQGSGGPRRGPKSGRARRVNV